MNSWTSAVPNLESNSALAPLYSKDLRPSSSGPGYVPSGFFISYAPYALGLKSTVNRNLFDPSSTKTLETKCGTSVKGPLKIVNELNVPETSNADNQATLAGPGASRASNVAEPAATETADDSVHVKSGFVSSSGIAAAILDTVDTCDVLNESVVPLLPAVLVGAGAAGAGAAVAGAGTGTSGAAAVGVASPPPPPSRIFKYSSKDGAALIDFLGSSCFKASGSRVSAIPPAPKVGPLLNNTLAVHLPGDFWFWGEKAVVKVADVDSTVTSAVARWNDRRIFGVLFFVVF
mmetsp:Transcript_21196/g.50391  ORF Transcript_21196/g.50391 Transcript_21196/m.50391 type:complete len:290 (+) Transcript_21196:492-1361(+)